jgi:hypothetical protein
MLSFKYLSMAFRKSGKPGQDVYLTLFEEESFETNVIVYFVFVMVDCILFQNALIDLSLVNLDSSCNLVKLLRALNKSLYR